MERFESQPLAAVNPRGCAVIVPLNAPSVAGMAEVAAQARGVADVVEVRLDALTDLPRIIEDEDWGFLAHIREVAAAPILATIRTADQGGDVTVPFMTYAEGVADVARQVEYVDVEWDPQIPEPILGGLIDAVRQGGARSVVSRHDFDGMATVADVDAYFAGARNLGAHVAKLAVTPAQTAQVAQLLQVVARHAQQSQQQAQNMSRIPTPPMEVLGIAMGKVGMVSRLSGHLFGNCATFAALPGHSSAPGQPDAVRLVSALDALQAVL